MNKRRFTVAALVLTILAAMVGGGQASATARAKPVVWVFGHSIAAGIGTSDTAHSWVGRFNWLNHDAYTIRNFAVGGAVFDGGTNTISAQVATAFNQQPTEVPAFVLIDAGTNDMVNHDSTTIVNSKYAAISISVALSNRGVPVTKQYFMGILPMGYGSSHPDNWVPVLTARSIEWNNWSAAMPWHYVNMRTVLHEDNDYIVRGNGWQFNDGLHPGDDAALLIGNKLDNTIA